MVRDNSVNIRQSVDDVIHELVLGAILTVIVVMLFLNDWKATAITSLALPVSVISSFMLMDALGFTLNVLTLMGAVALHRHPGGRRHRGHREHRAAPGARRRLLYRGAAGNVARSSWR